VESRSDPRAVWGRPLHAEGIRRERGLSAYKSACEEGKRREAGAGAPLGEGRDKTQGGNFFSLVVKKSGWGGSWVERVKERISGRIGKAIVSEQESASPSPLKAIGSLSPAR